MKTLFAVAGALLIGGSLIAADADAKAEVKAAAKKLADKPNYSWTARTEGGSSQTGTSDGQTEKGGTIYLKMSFGDRTFEAAKKGDKAAFKGENGWESTADLGDERAWIARRLQTFKAPAEEAQDLADKTKSLKKADGVYSGELTEDGAKEYILLSRRNANPKDAKGTVKFWVKDGELTKYEYNLRGKITRNEEEIDLDRTTTVEVKNVGSTKVTLPEEAKKLL